jgi:hypothetical protein
MLDGGFFATALAFVGITPTHEALRCDPPPLPIPAMTPVPVAANGHPTTMASPRKPVAPVSAQPSQSQKKSVVATDVKTRLTQMAIDPFDAVRFFLDEWMEYADEGIVSHKELFRSYEDFRTRQSSIPKLSPKKFSQMLMAHGSRRFVEDRRRVGGDGTRPVFYEIRAPRNSQRRAAA